MHVRGVQLDLHTVGILEVDGIAARGPDIGMPILIQNVHSTTPQQLCHLVHLPPRSGMKRKMVEPRMTAMIWLTAEPLFGLHKYEICRPQPITPSTRLVLVN